MSALVSGRPNYKVNGRHDNDNFSPSSRVALPQATVTEGKLSKGAKCAMTAAAVGTSAEQNVLDSEFLRGRSPSQIAAQMQKQLYSVQKPMNPSLVKHAMLCLQLLNPRFTHALPSHTGSA